MSQFVLKTGGCIIFFIYGAIVCLIAFVLLCFIAGEFAYVIPCGALFGWIIYMMAYILTVNKITVTDTELCYCKMRNRDSKDTFVFKREEIRKPLSNIKMILLGRKKDMGKWLEDNLGLSIETEELIANISRVGAFNLALEYAIFFYVVGSDGDNILISAKPFSARDCKAFIEYLKEKQIEVKILSDIRL